MPISFLIYIFHLSKGTGGRQQDHIKCFYNQERKSDRQIGTKQIIPNIFLPNLSIVIGRSQVKTYHNDEVYNLFFIKKTL